MMEFEDHLNESIIIQVTYNGGCGFAFLKKQRVLEDIKKYLILKCKITNDSIKTIMFNYETIEKNPKEINYMDKWRFNINEFNIFAIKQNERVLLGTSEIDNDLYDPYLYDGMKKDKENFLLKICQQINEIYKISAVSIKK